MVLRDKEKYTLQCNACMLGENGKHFIITFTFIILLLTHLVKENLLDRPGPGGRAGEAWQRLRPHQTARAAMLIIMLGMRLIRWWWWCWEFYMELAEGVAELVGGETGKESSLLAWKHFNICCRQHQQSSSALYYLHQRHRLATCIFSIKQRLETSAEDFLK